MKIAITAIIIIVVACSLMLFFYDIKFNAGGYDILFSSRRSYDYGWGVKYKENFEIWQFAENLHGGSAENIIYPRYSDKKQINTRNGFAQKGLPFKHIIGLILQVLGTIILAWRVLLVSMRKFLSFDWKQIPPEVKFFLRLLGIKGKSSYLYKLFSGETFLRFEEFNIKQRLRLYMPLIGLIFILTGLILNFK